MLPLPVYLLTLFAVISARGLILCQQELELFPLSGLFCPLLGPAKKDAQGGVFSHLWHERYSGVFPMKGKGIIAFKPGMWPLGTEMCGDLHWRVLNN